MAMSFTKGLEHDNVTGLVEDPLAFESFRTAIDDGFIDAFTTSVRASPSKRRKWEAPTAGIVYELSGPDPQSVTMPPAPAFVVRHRLPYVLDEHDLQPWQRLYFLFLGYPAF
jgi:hypothetical protein